MISGTLARLLGQDGYKTLAIDVDPAMNLSYSIGISSEVASKIIPLSENHTLIEERTGASPNSTGGVFSLNPTVSDIAEKYGVSGPDGTKLLVMGTIKSAGSGCMCPTNSLAKALIRHLLVSSKEAVIMDMEAGLEHLGRGTVSGVDAMLCIVEPRTQSFETARRIKELSIQLGVKTLLIVGNKMKNDAEFALLKKAIKELDIPLLGTVPYDELMEQADMARIAPLDFAPNSPVIKAIESLKNSIIKNYSIKKIN